MAKTKSDDGATMRWYRGRNVPIAVIRRFARDVVEQFQPERIILFGSHAYGRPHADSDVDILVVMPARNQLDQAARISQAIEPPFALDIIVRTPENLRWRLAEGDSFLNEIMTRGKVLYEKTDGAVGDFQEREAADQVCERWAAHEFRDDRVGTTLRCR